MKRTHIGIGGVLCLVACWAPQLRVQRADAQDRSVADEDVIPPEVLEKMDAAIRSGQRPTIRYVTKSDVWRLRENPAYTEDFVALDLDVDALSSVQRQVFRNWLASTKAKFLLENDELVTYGELFGLEVSHRRLSERSSGLAAEPVDHVVSTDCGKLRFRTTQHVITVGGLPDDAEVVARAAPGAAFAGRVPTGKTSLYFRVSPTGIDSRRWDLNFYHWALGLAVPGPAKTDVAGGVSVPAEEDTADTQPTSGGVLGGNAFGDRRAARAKLRGSEGGRKSQVAVDLALEWLSNHQSPGGHWDSDGFQDLCKVNQCSAPGESVYDPAQSGLALLCFLGAGETHNSGQHKETVGRGLRYLTGIQDGEGCFGPQVGHQWTYNHMCAALAMVEAYGMTGSPIFERPAQRGVNFVHKSQNPYLAWRYGIRDGENDTSVTGWAVMVLKSAKMAELKVDAGAFRGAMAWIEKMTDPKTGRVGYQRRGGPPARTQDMQEKFPADQSESLSGVGLLVRIFAGQDPARNEFIKKGAALMAKKPPRWDVDAGAIDFYYWYYATLSMFQVGGKYWPRWRAATETAIVQHQRTDVERDEVGSWDPVDPWAPEGGRIYSTAVNCLTLEAPYRYRRVFEPNPGPEDRATDPPPLDLGSFQRWLWNYADDAMAGRWSSAWTQYRSASKRRYAIPGSVVRVRDGEALVRVKGRLLAAEKKSDRRWGAQAAEHWVRVPDPQLHEQLNDGDAVTLLLTVHGFETLDDLKRYDGRFQMEFEVWRLR